MAKTMPPKLGGQPPVNTGGQPARVTQPSLPAVGTKSGAVQSQPPQDPKAQKKKLKDVDWSQKGYFDGDGLQAGGVERPQESAPKRGRTLIIPAVQEQPPQAEAESPNLWGEAESPSTHDAKETREAKETQKGREAEAKAAAEKRALGGSSSILTRKTEKLAVQPPPLPGGDKPKGTLYEMLENAKEPGELYTEDDGGGGDQEQEEEDPELMEAVDECIQRLFGVRGIHHIGPGTSDAGEKVIIIATTQGFGEESMRRVPAEVRGFKTLVALPFDLLPLKRTGPR
ncbi:MAG TPA: hypothetical protein VFA20_07200 [Myxococcaceae bacterium]|nr:hypothetical protein [Myxococcaceae bacterium]